jgi:hypothetical protein
MKMKFVVALAVACLVLSQVNAQQSHPAWEIEPGTFGSGNYIFPTQLGIGGSPTQLLEVSGIGRIQLTDPTNPNKWIAFRNQAGGLDLSYQGAPLWLSAYDNQNIIMNPGTGNVGIGTSSPAEKLHITGSVRGDQSGALRISTGNGYVDVGPKNAAWSHFYTDRTRYYFNTGITVDTGNIGSYNENFNLQTSGTTRLTILNSNGNVGIGTTSPSQLLHLKQNIAEGPMIRLDRTDNSNIDDVAILGIAYWSGTNDDSLWIGRGTADTDKKFILRLNSGNVGIGTTGPSSKLEVAGNVELTNLYDNDATNFFDGGCGDNSHVTGISSTGAISCAADTGDISAVNTGTPLTGGCTSGTCNIDITIPTCSGTDKLTSSDGNSFTCAADEGGVGGDSDWIISGSNMYSGVSGNVGIGRTPSSDMKLDINQIGSGTYAFGIRTLSKGASNNYAGDFRAEGGSSAYGVTGFAVSGTTKNYGVWGEAITTANAENIGLFGRAAGNGVNYGTYVVAQDNGGTTSTNYGVRALARWGVNNYGVHSEAYDLTGTRTNYAFYGNAYGGATNWGLYIESGNAYFPDNVGIGTTTPNTILHLMSGTPWIKMSHDSWTVGDLVGLEVTGPNDQNIARIGIQGTGSFGGHIHFDTSVNNGAYQHRMTILEGGNVGIGTTSPSKTLDVNGDVRISNTLEFTKSMDQILFTAGTDDWYLMSKGAPADNKAFAVWSPSGDGGSYSDFKFWVEEDGDTSVTGDLTVNGNVIMGRQEVSGSCSDCLSKTLTCPAGKKVLGGGCSIIGPYGSLKGSLPNGDAGWMCVATELTTIYIYAICARIG